MEIGLIEGVLFAAAKPISYAELAAIFDVSERDVKEGVKELEQKLAEVGSGLAIREVEDAVELVTVPECGKYIEKIRKREEKLSSAAVETLAIIAFKQPITKTEIEEIRGVNCEKVLKQLQSKNFIEDLGRKEVLGRPILYGTTSKFLTSVGISSLEELKVEYKSENLLSAKDLTSKEEQGE